jgi:hypothetical protein
MRVLLGAHNSEEPTHAGDWQRFELPFGRHA